MLMFTPDGMTRDERSTGKGQTNAPDNTLMAMTNLPRVVDAGELT